jgi:hypothetical protein
MASSLVSSSTPDCGGYLTFKQEDILSLRKQKLRQSFRKLEQKLEDIDGLVGGPEHTTERLLTLTYRAFSHYNRRYQILN